MKMNNVTFKKCIIFAIILLVLFIIKERIHFAERKGSNLPKINKFNGKKIVFITAIFGPYESSCKQPVNQTIPADFICFTDNKNLKSDGWEVDNYPYHLVNKSTLDSGEYINSFQKNNHTFNYAKYYKQAFYNIPRLEDYDIVVWLDGTVEIRNQITAEWLVEKIETQPIITWEHKHRFGSLESEVKDSMFDKYNSTSWLGQNQPYQDVEKQYKTYLKDGYREDLWHHIDPKRKHLGVWVTSFVAFDNKSKEVRNFLDLWYLQTLNYTTQDQVGFSYTVQKLKLYPYTLPDASIKGDSDRNDFYLKHEHQK